MESLRTHLEGRMDWVFRGPRKSGYGVKLVFQRCWIGMSVVQRLAGEDGGSCRSHFNRVKLRGKDGVE
jgi:hypothetical protein